MADPNPTGDTRLVSLDLPGAQAEILCRDLASWIDSLDADLRTPERLKDPAWTRAEADACRRMLDGVEAGEVRAPDPEAARFLRGAAEAHDRETDYVEVVAVHDAMHALLAPLESGR
ncbi:MAG TPA: hypothetical protein VFI09_09665 [Solirubrobacterales bacterium]|nr:hypothetical protein [Solirubrobacterales bacterium]